MIGLDQIEMLYQIKYSAQYLQNKLHCTINQGDNRRQIKFHHYYPTNGTNKLSA